MKFLVRNDRQLFAEFDSLSAAERYYMICRCYTDPTACIVREPSGL